MANRSTSKLKNIKTTVDGIVFDSKAEARRYCELKLLQRTGVISGLELQKRYELIPKVILGGKVKPPIRYICDFFYIKDNKEVVEDVKSKVTANLPVYRIKKHLMKYVHNIEILEHL